MFSTMESEERTNVLEGMHKLGLSTREVVSFMEKLRYAKRYCVIAKTGIISMQEKLRDSKGEGMMLRGKRKGLREELESLILKSSQKYKKIIRKMKDRVKIARGKIKVRNKEKIKRYREMMESRRKEEEGRKEEKRKKKDERKNKEE